MVSGFFHVGQFLSHQNEALTSLSNESVLCNEWRHCTGSIRPSSGHKTAFSSSIVHFGPKQYPCFAGRTSFAVAIVETLVPMLWFRLQQCLELTSAMLLHCANGGMVARAGMGFVAAPFAQTMGMTGIFLFDMTTP